jgi:hypothetical protein
MKQTKIILVILLTLIGSSWVFAADEPVVRIELTGAWTDIDPNLDAWWAEPLRLWDSDYEKSVSESPGLRFSELRVSVPFKRVEFFAAFETEPDFSASATAIGQTANTLLQTGEASVEAYDLGVVVPLDLGSRFRLRPWGGLSHLRIRQESLEEQWYGIGSGVAQQIVRDLRFADDLWGVVYGAEGVADLTTWLAVTARGFQRWGAGTTTQTYIRQENYFDEPIAAGDEPVDSHGFQGDYSMKTSTTMFGFDLGLRASLVRWFALEGGWRYRDWSYDRSPGAYDGPFIRCAFSW